MKFTVPHALLSLALAGLLLGCGKSPEKAPAPPAEIALPTAASTDAATSASPPWSQPEEPTLTEAEAAAVVATINGTPLTEGEIHKVLTGLQRQLRSRVTPEEFKNALPRIRERIIEDLVMRRILLDAVAKAGISLSEAEFEEIKKELADELPPGMSLETYLEEMGTTEEELRQQMTVRKLVLAQAEAIAKPTEEEIKEYYDFHREDFSQEETVTASHILIKTDPNEPQAEKDAKRARIEALKKKLQEGADFSELAKKHSECPSSVSGGDLGAFGRGQMVAEFEAAAFSQPTGSVGDVVETQFGYHLIKVTDHTFARTLEFSEVKQRISDMLHARKQQEAIRGYIERLQNSADVQRFDTPPDKKMVETPSESELWEDDANPAVETQAPSPANEDETISEASDTPTEENPEEDKPKSKPRREKQADPSP